MYMLCYEINYNKAYLSYVWNISVYCIGEELPF